MESPDTVRMLKTCFQMKDIKPIVAKKVKVSFMSRPRRRRRGGGLEPLRDERGGRVRFWRGGGRAVGVLKRGGCGGRGLAARIVASVREDVEGISVKIWEYCERRGWCRRRMWWWKRREGGIESIEYARGCLDTPLVKVYGERKY